MARQIRRVVTGHNAEGKSIFLMDEPNPHVFQRSPGSAIVNQIWETDRTPADNRGREDPFKPPYRLAPPKGGTTFRIIEYPPDKERAAALAQQLSDMQDSSGRAQARTPGEHRHPGFHKTATIDYAIVLSGEIYALMDEGEVLLKAGDVLIQRGTNHAWSVRGDEPATVAFVLIDAEPV